MFLRTLKISNFRKYGVGEDDKPGLIVQFKKGLNVLIGENESGKSTIVDAIRFVLQTQSMDYSRLNEIDFHCTQSPEGELIRTNWLRIECEFERFSHSEAGNFLEWIGFKTIGDRDEYVLRVWLIAERKDNRIISEIRAGLDDVGSQLDGKARDLLRVTYLKPLRDAEMEMSSGRRSRFAQLLRSHDLFKDAIAFDKSHPIKDIVAQADQRIGKYFGKDYPDDYVNKIRALIKSIKLTDHQLENSKEIVEFLETQIEFLECADGFQIVNDIRDKIEKFTVSGAQNNPFVSLAGVELWAILQRLTLNIDNNQPSLGLMNLLYIAAELLLLKRSGYNGLRLTIIEELEAHLHPHYQLNVLKSLSEKPSETENSSDTVEQSEFGQIILTTHSVILGSSIPLKNMIICKGNNVFPMGREYTKLEDDDEAFLERFLDATKANLFFARGVIIVEGDAENLLIPALAEAIDLPLHKYGVSIVKVGSRAWERYVCIFERKDDLDLDVKVSVVADGDIPIGEYFKDYPPKVYTNDDKRIIETSRVKFREKLKEFDITLDDSTRKKPLDEEWIPDYIELIKSRESQYQQPSNSGIIFFFNDWTLEYNIAQSFLKEHFLDSLTEAKKLLGYSVSIPSNADKPYELMKPLLKGLSKAVTAQFLAKKIIEKKESLKNEITNDDYLKYLIAAIKHACS